MREDDLVIMGKAGNALREVVEEAKTIIDGGPDALG
jgi:hypothetical protein